MVLLGRPDDPQLFFPSEGETTWSYMVYYESYTVSRNEIWGLGRPGETGSVSCSRPAGNVSAHRAGMEWL